VSDILNITREGRVLRIALNRPEKRNALNADLCRNLVHAIETAQSDQSVGAILLTGTGKHFSAGMDLSEVASSATEDITIAQEHLFTIGLRLAKPVIAAVQGASLGGGLGLVGNCHIVIAHPDATFGLTELRLGLWPFLVFRALVLALGERRVVELALTGRIFGASEAKEMGLVHEVSDDPQARGAALAAALAQSSATTIHAGLSFVNEVRGLDWATAGEIARRARDEVFASPDFGEGLHAFLEKRAPRWPSLKEENS
jgi:enoyl-CoA hydratase/carnithine racemase